MPDGTTKAAPPAYLQSDYAAMNAALWEAQGAVLHAQALSTLWSVYMSKEISAVAFDTRKSCAHWRALMGLWKDASEAASEALEDFRRVVRDWAVLTGIDIGAGHVDHIDWTAWYSYPGGPCAQPGRWYELCNDAWHAAEETKREQIVVYEPFCAMCKLAHQAPAPEVVNVRVVDTVGVATQGDDLIITAKMEY